MNLPEPMQTHAGTVHPSLEELRAFVWGELNEDSSEEIEQHLSGCIDCCERLDTEAADPLARLFRAAGSMKALALTKTMIEGNPADLHGSNVYNVRAELAKIYHNLAAVSWGQPRRRALGATQTGRGTVSPVTEAPQGSRGASSSRRPLQK